ncbi:MAG: alanine/ornithine racemase family PLP-dependent enzyme [Bacilli bacterium]|jgi:predicted amino acid racemase|nr:alanine/ornithine racemase family PLP-dependent enzyme [Bacilli bacterium]
MYPRLNINIKHLLANVDFMYQEFDYLDELYVVTKAYCANIDIIDELYHHNVRYFADSRIANIKKIKEKYPDTHTLHLRLPMHSEVDEIVKYANRSLNSELSTIKLLNDAAIKQNKTHEIILMIDVGDLREGIMYDSDYISFCQKILEFSNIKLVGIGTNVTCYGSVIPTKETLNLLIDIKKDIENTLNIELPIISGGNSSSVYLHFENEMPAEINNLRCGDIFITGTEAAYLKQIKGMYYDIFQLEAEIIELKNKPSYPIGKLGVNAFGETVEYEDVGIHTRAILAIGRQDVHFDNIQPLEKDIKVLGSSSDHLILEVPSNKYQVGDTIKFSLSYGGILSLSTSEYVKKNIIK